MDEQELGDLQRRYDRLEEQADKQIDRMQDRLADWEDKARMLVALAEDLMIRYPDHAGTIGCEAECTDACRNGANMPFLDAKGRDLPWPDGVDEDDTFVFDECVKHRPDIPEGQCDKGADVHPSGEGCWLCQATDALAEWEKRKR